MQNTSDIPTMISFAANGEVEVNGDFSAVEIASLIRALPLSHLGHPNRHLAFSLAELLEEDELETLFTFMQKLEQYAKMKPPGEPVDYQFTGGD